MAELTKLDLRTADRRPLVHKYYRHVDSSKGLVVTFPGNHYGVDGPLLYLPSKHLRTSGWDTLAITYGFQSRGDDFSSALVPELMQECQEALQAGLTQREYSRVGLIGKSLGAMVVAQLCASLPELDSARAVYLTPPINTPFFDQYISKTKQPVYIALGTKDRFFSAEAVERLRTCREVNLTIIDDADHSMDIEGDLGATMEGLKRVVQEVVDFLVS